MITSEEKISRMHGLFGSVDDKCKNCRNFTSGYVNGLLVHKCIVYGVSHSASTDWRVNFQACGMFNQNWAGDPVRKVLAARAAGIQTDDPLEGQIEMEL